MSKSKTNTVPVRVPRKRAGAKAHTTTVHRRVIPTMPVEAPRTQRTAPAAPKFDADGFDVHGRSSRGYDRDGFYPNNRHAWTGVHRDTGTEYDIHGFSRGVHRDTGTNLSPEGKTWLESLPARDGEGYDLQGHDIDGFNRDGFDCEGEHRDTETEFDPQGYDTHGCDVAGYDRAGFYTAEYERDTHVDAVPFTHRDTGTEFDPLGFDIDGINRRGKDSTGYHWGLTHHE